MGFFKSSRKELLTRTKERAAESLCRSSYPIRRQQSPCDSRPLPVAFAKSDTEGEGESDSEHEETRQIRIPQVKTRQSNRQGITLVFNAFGHDGQQLASNLDEKKISSVEVHEIAAPNSDDSDDTISCITKDDAHNMSDQVDSLQVTPIRDSIQLRKSSLAPSLYSMRNHQKSKIDISSQSFVASQDVSTGLRGQDRSSMRRSSLTMPQAQEPERTKQKERDSRRSSRASALNAAPRCQLQRRPSIHRTRSFLKPLQNGSDSSTVSVVAAATPLTKPSSVLPKPRLLAVLEIRLQTLQDQYNELNLQYRQLTSNQVDTLEIVKDIKSDLCTTQITTAENSIEISGLQDSQRQLAAELETLKLTVSDCKKELRGLSASESARSIDPLPDNKSRSDRKWRVKAGTMLDLSQKEKPQRMSLEDYKLHCAQRQSSPESLARTTSLASVAESAHDELIDSGTAKPLTMDTVAAQSTRQSTRRPLQVVRKKVPESFQTIDGVNSKPHRFSHDKFKVMAKERISSVSYFHRFRTKAARA